MNELKLDNLISGLTRNTEAQTVLSDNISNTENNNNTSKRKNPSNIGNTGNSSNVKTNEEIRFCTIVQESVLRKIRVIAKREGLQIKEVVGAAFVKAISSYEAKHGEITGDGRSRTDSLF